MTHWKILRDPYLSPLCLRHGEQAVWEAGFFFDDDPEHASLDDVDWLCTPRPKLAITGSRPAVLLSTGGFFPVHAGHLEMMERARTAAQAAGFDVVGGYLSPGHDQYLRMKCGPDALAANERLRRSAEAVAGSEWLSVDPWEAMHCRVAVNFTDVTARLEAYLRAHVDPRLQVIYVCGGDNARFAQAFRERGHCIVVARPGAQAELLRWRAQLAGQERLIWVEADNPAASRSLRGDAATQPGLVRPRLVVRLEDARAARTLGLANLSAFQSELLALLGQHAALRSVAPSEPASGPGVINLDAMQGAQHNLAISRLFALGGYELLGHVARPGAPPLAEQLARIPAGRYVLRDDDRVTGSTLAAVRSLLPAHLTVVDAELAVVQAAGEEVVDSRDFLLGADDGGLVLALPGAGLARAPYLLPYVDPHARASIAASHAFSIDVWELNARTFSETALRVPDLPAPSRALFRVDEDMTLAQLCTWHAERLRRIVALSPRQATRS